MSSATDWKERTLRPSDRIDLARTVAPLRRGVVDPTMRVAPGAVLRASRTPQGPVTLHARATGDEIAVRAWGPGAEWALEQSPQLLGLSDDPSSFRPTDGKMRELLRRLDGVRMARSNRIVETLIPTIIEQRVQGMEARRSYRKLVIETSDPAPGPGRLMLPPDPQKLAAMPYFEFHHFGIERRRADAIRRVCTVAPRLEDVCDMTRRDAEARLGSVLGVGPWTQSYAMRLALGDPDSVILRDLNLPGVVAWALAGERTADDARMLELLAPFAGHRGRAMLLIDASGARPPRRAPRARASSIAAI